MKKIFLATAIIFLLAICTESRADNISVSRPESSRMVLQLDNDLNFRVTIEYSDLAGGVMNSTIYIMIAFQENEKLVVYDVFPLKITTAEGEEVLANGMCKGKLEFSVKLSEYTDVKEFEDLLEIRMFLVDVLGRKSRTKSMKLNTNKKDWPDSDKLHI